MILVEMMKNQTPQFKDVLRQYANVSVFYTILTFYNLSEHKNCELNRYARIAFTLFFTCLRIPNVLKPHLL